MKPKAPWIVHKEKSSTFIVYSEEDDYAVARAFTDGKHSEDEVAELICRAVNSHDQLVAALKVADRFCGSLTSEECPDTVHNIIRLALAAAEGEGA